MSAHIHPTAIVAPGAELDANVVVGPYCIIGPRVRIGADTVLKSHVNVDGHITIGAGCTVWPFASLGTQSQDLKFRGGTPRVEIGDGTTIREYVTINAATAADGLTRVGQRCHLMAYAHIAHECIVGNEVIMANAATLAGHVIVEDQVIIGGLCGVHQFVRLGRLCITGGCSKVVQDVPPFMTSDGNPLTIHGLNLIGLKRKGVTEETMAELKQAHQILYREGLNTSQALERMTQELAVSPEIQHLLDFIRASTRGITR